jgi:hypothetical protein
MVIYTCIRKINKDYYECYKGTFEFPETNLEDYRMISIPSSTLTFELFQNFEEQMLLLLNIHPKYRKKTKFYY